MKLTASAGGEIVRIAGDAMIIVWDGRQTMEDGDPSRINALAALSSSRTSDLRSSSRGGCYAAPPWIRRWQCDCAQRLPLLLQRGQPAPGAPQDPSEEKIRADARRMRWPRLRKKKTRRRRRRRRPAVPGGELDCFDRSHALRSAMRTRKLDGCVVCCCCCRCC